MRIRHVALAIGVSCARASVLDAVCERPEWQQFEEKVVQFVDHHVPFTESDLPTRGHSADFGNDCMAGELFLLGLSGVDDEQWQRFGSDWWKLVQSPFPLFKYWSKVWPYRNLDHRTAEG